jgi:hypothetical protein
MLVVAFLMVPPLYDSPGHTRQGLFGPSRSFEPTRPRIRAGLAPADTASQRAMGLS